MPIDSHCHLTIRFEKHEIPSVLNRAFKAGVRGILIVGYDPGHFELITELLDRHIGDNKSEPSLAGTIGIHPHEADKYGPGDVENFRDDLSRPDIIAIGETGLDFFRDYANRSRQEDLFRAQVRLSAETGYPLIIHSRAAFDRTIKILSEFTLPSKPGVFHCYGYGSREIEVVTGLGFFVSFAGNLTYQGAGELHRAARIVPEDRVLIETDSPFLVPESGKNRKVRRNEPAFVMETFEKLVEFRGLDMYKAREMIISNMRECFPALAGISNWPVVAGLSVREEPA